MGLFAYTDGACRVSNPGLCSSAYAVFTNREGQGNEVYGGARCIGTATNNVAEYTGLLDLLRMASGKGLREITIHSDSMLVVEQVNGNWKCRPPLDGLRNEAYVLLIRGGHTLKHVKGHSGVPGNERVDHLCNEVLDRIQKEKGENV